MILVFPPESSSLTSCAPRFVIAYSSLHTERGSRNARSAHADFWGTPRKDISVSRIGKKPVDIPQGVSLNVDKDRAMVRGPKGELTVKLNSKVELKLKDGRVEVYPRSDDREGKALQGLTRSLVANAVFGVTQGFERKLHVIGIGYRADVEEKNLRLLLGFSHPVTVPAPDDIEFEVQTASPSQLNIVGGEVEGTVTIITVRGIDKEVVGQTAANIRFLRPPEPYKGKGIRYDGEFVRRKAGKTAI